jgi:hypothetical protein
MSMIHACWMQFASQRGGPALLSKVNAEFMTPSLLSAKKSEEVFRRYNPPHDFSLLPDNEERVILMNCLKDHDKMKGTDCQKRLGPITDPISSDKVVLHYITRVLALISRGERLGLFDMATIENAQGKLEQARVRNSNHQECPGEIGAGQGKKF